MEDQKETESTDLAPIIATQWPNTARYIGALIFILALLALIFFVSPILRALVSALLLAFIVDIPIRYFSRRTKVSYLRIALIIYLLLYILAALFLFVGWRFLVDYLPGVISDLSAGLSKLQSTLQGISQETTTSGPVVVSLRLDNLVMLLEAAVKYLLDVLSAPIVTYAKFAIVVVYVGFALFLSNLLIFSAYGARGRLRYWVPEVFDREAYILFTWFDRIWGNYLVGIGLFAVVLGAGSIVEFWILGVPYPVLFGILTGLICLLPLVGGFLSGLIVFIPCFLIGSTRFQQIDPLVFAIIVTIVNDLVCTVSYNFIALPVIGKLVRLPYWVTLAGVLMGFAFNNILFAFLVIPIFSTLRMLYTYLLAKVVGHEPFPGQAKPTGPAIGFLSQFLLDEK
jgi:predicted PurR-regulated permease PerM